MRHGLVITLFLVIFSGSVHANEFWANGQLGTAPVLTGYEGVKASYVCRASGIPGKLIASDRKCYIGYYGKEYPYTNYQVLQDPSRRTHYVNHRIAQNNLVVFGGWENGTGLWICRVRTANGYVGGKLVQGSPTDILSGAICYYGYYGKEYSSTEYDVLSY